MKTSAGLSKKFLSVMMIHAINSRMSRIDYEKFLVLRGRLSSMPQPLAEHHFLNVLESHGYDFIDYFGAHAIFSQQKH